MPRTCCRTSPNAPNDHDPDQQAHRQVDLGHFKLTNGLEHAGQELTQRHTQNDAQKHPQGEVTLESGHD
jgi:hypothetical protein